MSVPMIEVGKSGKTKKSYVPVSEKDYHHRVANTHINFKCPGHGFGKRKIFHYFKPDYLTVYNKREDAVFEQVRCSCGKYIHYKAWKEKGQIRVEAKYKNLLWGIKPLDVVLFAEAEA